MVKYICSVVGKTAIVTGASSGLGEEFAQILASRGANVVLAARRTDRLQELAESIMRDGGTALPITCDVADSAQVKDMVATCRTYPGHAKFISCWTGSKIVGEGRSAAISDFPDVFRYPERTRPSAES